MKLWKKLSLMTVTVLMAAMAASGMAVIYRSTQYNQEKTLEGCEQQLSAAAYALGKELEYGPLEGYSEATRNSYVNYLIKKIGAEKYILVQDGKVICNLTAFELKKPEDERWNRPEGYSIIQKRGNQYIIVAGKQVPAVGKEQYRLFLVQDISELYEDMKAQALFNLAVFAGAALLSLVLIFLMTQTILHPLRKLQQAARDISEGKLTSRVDVHTKDEIGVVAKAFNRMAERIEDQVTELSQVSERRRQMLGSLAHELKTPMTSIIGYSDSLLHVNLREEQKERALQHIREECSRLERLSSKLLSLMGMYENDSIFMEDTTMKELFERVARLEEHHLQKKKLTLIWSCDMENRKVDRDLIESLLVNLIDNSAKASKEGGQIFLEGEKDRIRVRDQGCGIPEDEISRVTEAFYMVDKARSRKAGGCGLGLALASRIALLHGAELHVESKLGKGTEVSIIFRQ